MSIIDEVPAKRSYKAPVDVAKPVEVPLEYWVGWVVRPFDGGWKLRRVRIPLHVLEMVATDKDAPADRRELVVAKLSTEAAHPTLSVRTDWGTPIGHTVDPVPEEMTEMLDHYTVNQAGQRMPVYRQVPKAAYDRLPEEIRAAHKERVK